MEFGNNIKWSGVWLHFVNVVSSHSMKRRFLNLCSLTPSHFPQLSHITLELNCSPGPENENGTDEVQMNPFLPSNPSSSSSSLQPSSTAFQPHTSYVTSSTSTPPPESTSTTTRPLTPLMLPSSTSTPLASILTSSSSLQIF